MTICTKQSDKLTVVVDKEVTTPLDNKSPENHRKYHSYTILEWGTCAKSNWLSVVKSCGLCLLLAWMCWLQLSNYQLSMDVLKLKNEFSFSTKINEYQLEKDSNSQVENTQSNSDIIGPLVYKHPARKKRRKRGHRTTTIRDEIKDQMKKHTFALFLPGTNGTRKDYFKWNLTYAGSNDFVTSHINGTFTFKKRGFYLVATQLTVKGINIHQNYGTGYGYETVLVKANHQEEVLMRSEITQDNRGTPYTLRGTNNEPQHSAIDSISHLVMRYFEMNDNIAIKKYTNSYNVNYHLTERNSYIGIVALDLWHV